MKKILWIPMIAVFFLAMPRIATAGDHDVNDRIPVTWTGYSTAFSDKSLTLGQPTILLFSGPVRGGEAHFHTFAMQKMNESVAYVKISIDSDWKLVKSWGIDPHKAQSNVIVFDKHGNEYKRNRGGFKSRWMTATIASMDKYFKSKVKKLEKKVKKVKDALKNGAKASSSDLKKLQSVMNDIKGYDVAVEAKELYDQIIEKVLEEVDGIVDNEDSLKIKKRKLKAMYAKYKKTEAGESIKDAIADIQEEIEDSKENRSDD